MDRGKKTVRCEIIFRQNFTEALAAERFCIQDLVTAAGIGSKRNQQCRLTQLQKFADGICTGSGDYDIRERKQICQLLFDIFKLYLAFCAI